MSTDSTAYTWVLANDLGEAVAGPGAGGGFPTQAEAEAWLRESWEELAEAGIAQVTLRHDGMVVYGPMSLGPDA